MHYTHITPLERESISIMVASGQTIGEIARSLKRSKSTISREVRRNSGEDGYSPLIASAMYIQRRLKCHRPHIIENEEVYNYVKIKFLDQHWSPEQIDGRMKLDNESIRISRSTIYREIENGTFDVECDGKKATRRLRHKGRKRHTQGSVENRGKFAISHDLEERPDEANNRGRIGDWEVDTVLGKVGKACLVTLVDRMSRYLIVGKVESKNAEAVNQFMIKALSSVTAHTVTPDRGKEFSKHVEFTKATGVEAYFPQPHQPWQRGTNENTNGLLREFFPKGYDLTETSDEEIQGVMDKINNRPRRILGYRTPSEVYNELALHLQ